MPRRFLRAFTALVRRRWRSQDLAAGRDTSPLSASGNAPARHAQNANAAGHRVCTGAEGIDKLILVLLCLVRRRRRRR